MSFNLIFLFLVFKTFLVFSQYVQYPLSPCSGTFDYTSDNGQTYGLITFRLSQPATSITLVTNFTVSATLPSRYVGRLEPLGTQLQLLEEANQGRPISFRVHFPISSPLPRLTQITVNGEVICYGYGDVPAPGVYVTTLSLQHTLFLKSGTIPINMDFFSNHRPDNNNQNRPNTIYNTEGFHDRPIFSVDDNVFTNNNGDSEWSADIYPFVTNNSTRPQNRPNDQHFFQNTRPTTSPPPVPTYAPIFVEPPRTTVPPWTSPPSRISHPSWSSPRQIGCGMVYGGNEKIPLIHNGQSYSRGDWPWLVAIYRKREGTLSFICSGTLISDRHVLSAAHCMHEKSSRTSNRDIVIKIGVYNLEDWGDDITVTKNVASTIIHESYNTKTLANDIVVFTLERAVEFNNNIRAACLWEGNTDLTRIVGASGVVTGWGQSEFGPGAHGEPRMVRIPVVSTRDCRASRPDFHKLTSGNTLCAGDRNGAGPCLGDSGSGLYMLEGGKWRVRGIVSLSLRPDNGENTCNLNEYIVFTDAAKYISWIENIISL